MAGNEPGARPRSPHLQVYKWTPAMAVSIFHRVSGDGLAIVGACMFLWWLGALAAGPDAYAAFVACVWHDPEAGAFHQVTNILGKIVLIGLTWAFFQHLLSGIRHLVMDTGAAFELDTNKRFAILTIVGSVILTAVLWAYLLGVIA